MADFKVSNFIVYHYKHSKQHAAFLLLRQLNMIEAVMPDLIRHPVFSWIPAFAGMTLFRYIIAGVIKTGSDMTGNIKV